MFICYKCNTKCIDDKIKDGDKCPLPNCTGTILEVPLILEDLYTALKNKKIACSEISLQGLIISIKINLVQIMEYLVDLPDLTIVAKSRNSIEITRQIKKRKNKKDQELEEFIAMKSMIKWINSLPELKVLLVGFNFLTQKEAYECEYYLAQNEICFFFSQTTSNNNYSLLAGRFIKANKITYEKNKLRRIGRNMGAIIIVF